MASPTILLNNGQKCPLLGLGTWLAQPGEAREVVKQAISIGYRLFDCAWVYGNEKEIGEGIRDKISDGTVKREDIFITTKLWNTFHEKNDVLLACKESLKNFGLDYIDLYLVHWPCAQKNNGMFDWKSPFDNAVCIDHDFIDTWRGMEECVRLGWTKSIGLSNFNCEQVQRVLDNARILPVINQIEVSPLLLQKKLIKFCQDRNVHITAYSPFGSPARTWRKPNDPFLDLEDARLVNVGNKHGKTGAQVILRYLVQQNIIAIPKSANEDRLKKNMDIFDFELTPEEMAVVESFDCNGRVVPAVELKDSPDYPFNN